MKDDFKDIATPITGGPQYCVRVGHAPGFSRCH